MTPSGDVMTHLAYLLARSGLKGKDSFKRFLVASAGKDLDIAPDVLAHTTGPGFGIRPEAQDKLNALIGGRNQYGLRIEEAQEPSWLAHWGNTSGWFPDTRQLPDETGRYRPTRKPVYGKRSRSYMSKSNIANLERDYPPIKSEKGSKHKLDSNDILVPRSWFNSLEEFIRALANADELPLYRGSTEAWTSGLERPGKFLEFPNRDVGWPGLGSRPSDAR